MKAIELIGDIDEQHRLRASAPEELPAGPVRLIVSLSEEDESGTVRLGFLDIRRRRYTIPPH
jgi:hypothetical protein